MAVRRAVAAAIVVLSGVLLLPGAAAAQGSLRACDGGTLLTTVVYRFTDEQDVTTEGDVWALTSGIAKFRLYQLDENTFCATTTYAGTFTTFAGPSPAGTGTVPAGLRGRMAGQTVVIFEGASYRPLLPTRGYVGSFDANCDQFQCATPIQFGRRYLEVTGPPALVSFRSVYVSRCGTWVATSEGESGDIAC
ncbi:MAG TPA: hypothetical protein VHG90_16015 [Acidimicrobiales bacterium]|nr:hypothetical protein [Acidimicrobiales bacterium]